MGTSYMAATQSAAATLNPPHLAAMFVTEGPSNYYHCSMRHNGALEQRFLIYAFHMAVTSPEARANPALRLALLEARTNLGQWLRRLPLKRGATPLRMLPSYEQWAIDLQTRAVYDEYWLQRGYAINEYYAEHADVPTVYFGAWYDSYARATTENFIALSRLKRSPQRLVMGPWVHGVRADEDFAGDASFGSEALEHYNGLRLRWFDQWLKGLDTGRCRRAAGQDFRDGRRQRQENLRRARAERANRPRRALALRERMAARRRARDGLLSPSRRRARAAKARRPPPARRPCVSIRKIRCRRSAAASRSASSSCHPAASISARAFRWPPAIRCRSARAPTCWSLSLSR